MARSGEGQPQPGNLASGVEQHRWPGAVILAVVQQGTAVGRSVPFPPAGRGTARHSRSLPPFLILTPLVMLTAMLRGSRDAQDYCQSGRRGLQHPSRALVIPLQILATTSAHHPSLARPPPAGDPSSSGEWAPHRHLPLDVVRRKGRPSLVAVSIWSGSTPCPPGGGRRNWMS